MHFLRKLAAMLRKDVLKLSEPTLLSGSDSVLPLSEVRVTGDSFVSDLLPMFDIARSSDNDETITKHQECCDGD